MDKSTFVKAKINRIKVLRAIHRFGWLRSRDLALIVWSRWNKASMGGFDLVTLARASPSQVRLAQKTVKNMREEGLLLTAKAADQSLLYALSSKGAQVLQGMGINSKSGKDMMRGYSLGYFQHRCISNEIAITAILEGYKVSTEREIACGTWVGGRSGFFGKLPDVFVRDRNQSVWIEVERSRKNQKDYLKLLTWLEKVRDWRLTDEKVNNLEFPNFKLMFVSSTAFKFRLIADLHRKGFRDSEINSWIDFKVSLYRMEEIGFR